MSGSGEIRDRQTDSFLDLAVETLQISESP
jgi:hypothetical protein